MPRRARTLTRAASVTSPRARREVARPASSPELETLNFKVASDFKREFKGYAVSQGLTMVDLLKEGFELSKQKRLTGRNG